ncbi:tRNA dimethylallyltransferase isoform X2 [Bombus pascuorum]|nr:tRNA dimethylallyltransferase isoform X2 [Bombus pascuorum]
MAPHHMLDILDPLKHNYSVVQFRDMAIPIINDLQARKKLPIIVGGTNYYIESILWKVLIDSIDMKKDGQSDEENVSCSKKMKIEYDRSTTKTNQELYEELVRVDPEMAKRFHSNNRRKIIRSLEVFEQYGIKHSELLKIQRTAGGSGLGGPLRHQNSILLWLRCDMKVLEERLDSRVDAMVETGLVQEMLDFHQRYNEERIKSNTSADYTKGIFQSIGFKEFHAYLVLPEDEKQEKKGQELLRQGIDDLKIVTKRYAKKQEKWIQNRLLRRSDRQVPPIYTLDCTNLDQWNSHVYEPAVAIIEAVLRGEKPIQKPLNETVENEKVSDSSNEERHYCDICDRIFIGEYQWNCHIKSIKHGRILARKKRLERLQKLEEEKQWEEQKKFEGKECAEQEKFEEKEGPMEQTIQENR